MQRGSSNEERVLLATSSLQEARQLARTLAQAGLAPVCCDTLAKACRQLPQGAGALLLAEEFLAPEQLPLLLETLKKQPPWSDLPLLLLTERADPAGVESLHGAVTLLDRSCRRSRLVGQLRLALRQRRRQYHLRDLLAQLRGNEERYRLLFDRCPDAIFALDPRGRVLLANPACQAISGFSPDELMQKKFLDVCAPDQLLQTIAQFLRCVRLRAATQFETAIIHKDGHRVDVWITGEPLLSQGKVVAVHCTGRDITARKAAEAALRAANQELQRFASVISHDLKAPLRGIQTMLTVLREDHAERLGPDGQQCLQRMVKSIRRMTAMIQDLLDYSRVGSTQQGPRPVPLTTLLADVIESLAPPPQVHVQVAPDLPLLEGEPLLLQQLFQNLLSNAIKFADKPRVEIRVDWADAGKLWELSVADNGPGIPARHFGQIFDMFQTLGPPSETESTGVGLAVVKRIVECAGGRVWVESSLGQGSTFRFTWPKRPRDAPRLPATPPPAPFGPRRQSAR